MIKVSIHLFFILTIHFSVAVCRADDEQVCYIPCDEGYPFSQGIARVSDSRYWKEVPNNSNYEIFQKYGFIDKKGKLIVPFLYEDAGDFKEGLASVAARRTKNKEELLYGYIDMKGEEVIPLIYQGADRFGEGLAPVKTQGRWGYVDKKGKIIIEPIYYEAKPFSEGLAAVKLDENKDWGFIDRKGKLVIPLIFNNDFEFSEGFTASSSSAHRRALFNSKGEASVTFEYGIMPIGSLSEGLIKLSGGYDEAAKRSLVGFGDKNGKIVIPIIYEGAFKFHEGLAAVRKNGKWGFIDKKGDFKINPVYHIDEGEFSGARPIFSEGLAFVQGGYIDKEGKWVLKTFNGSD